jgi:hypothetical protein
MAIAMLDASPFASTLSPAIRLGAYVDRLTFYVADRLGSRTGMVLEGDLWEIAERAADGRDTAEHVRGLSEYLSEELGAADAGVAEVLDLIVAAASEGSGR